MEWTKKAMLNNKKVIEELLKKAKVLQNNNVFVSNFGKGKIKDLNEA